MNTGYLQQCGLSGFNSLEPLVWKWSTVASILTWPKCEIITIKIIVVSNNSHIHRIHNNYNQ